MPTYEYRCKECGEELEVVQAFTDDPLTECRVCGGPLRKVFGNIGITFKGSGFYKNDSRSSSKKSAEKKSDTSTGEKSDTAAKTETTSDTKSKPKSESKPDSSSKSSSDAKTA